MHKQSKPLDLLPRKPFKPLAPLAPSTDSSVHRAKSLLLKYDKSVLHDLVSTRIELEHLVVLLREPPADTFTHLKVSVANHITRLPDVMQEALRHDLLPVKLLALNYNVTVSALHHVLNKAGIVPQIFTLLGHHVVCYHPNSS